MYQWMILSRGQTGRKISCYVLSYHSIEERKTFHFIYSANWKESKMGKQALVTRAHMVSLKSIDDLEFWVYELQSKCDIMVWYEWYSTSDIQINYLANKKLNFKRGSILWLNALRPFPSLLWLSLDPRPIIFDAWPTL